MRITIAMPRVVLRPIVMGDVAAAVDALQHKHVSQWLLNSPHPYGAGDAEAFFARMFEHEQKTGEPPPFAITLRGKSDRMMGCIGMHLTQRHKRAEMGYWLHPSLWGQGLVLEAVLGVFHAGFDGAGLLRISAGHFPGNEASARVMQKAGMTREGCLRKYLVKDGQSLDEIIYSITSEEWVVNPLRTRVAVEMDPAAPWPAFAPAG
jgi:RimJ/RimL family protein N-acetyltransferase